MIRIFKHYIPKTLLLLGASETLIMFVSIYLGMSLRFVGADSDIDPQQVLPKALVFTLAMVGIMTAVGLYEREAHDIYRQFVQLGLSFVLGLIAMTLIFYAVPDLFVGRGAFAISLLIALVGTGVVRGTFFTLSDAKGMKRRVLVLGTGSRAATVDDLERSLEGRAGFTVVGYLPLKSDQHFVDQRRILNDQGSSLCGLAAQLSIDEIVVGVRERRDGGLPIQEVLKCKMAGINVVELSTFFERETGHVQLASLNTSWMIFSDGFDRGSLRKSSKRIFDVLASATVLLLTAPLMLLTAIVVRLESRGPVLYKQERVGEAGRRFNILKFRSMRADAESDGKPRWASKDDDRVTRVGKFIRKVRIDELPQLFNVLRGEMSFVGPRPERPFFVEQLEKKIPYYVYRHNVKPGITGWAQIRYPYGASLKDSIEKLQYDLYYVKNHSLFLDLIILLQTAQVVLFGKGAR